MASHSWAPENEDWDRAVINSVALANGDPFRMDSEGNRLCTHSLFSGLTEILSVGHSQRDQYNVQSGGYNLQAGSRPYVGILIIKFLVLSYKYQPVTL